MAADYRVPETSAGGGAETAEEWCAPVVGVIGPGLTRDQRRSRRPRAVRATTITIKRVTKRERLHLRLLYPEADAVHDGRPRTRGDCVDGPRPCPYVSCRHHSGLDVTRTGGVTLNFPDVEPDELAVSCALDVADEGGATLERVGELMNITRERVRQIEAIAARKLRRSDTFGEEVE